MALEKTRSGVHRIPNLGFVNAYLVEIGQDKLALVDTGTPGSQEKVLSYVSSIGRKPGDIAYILLTHADADHSGSAAKLKSLTGATLAIHELDAPRITGEKKTKEGSGFGGLVIGLSSAFMRIERVNPDLLLKDGSVMGPLTVIHTPGHTDGSISLYKPSEALLVGDLMRTNSSGAVKLASPMMSKSMDEVKRSVERISRLDFQILMPGHGPPVMEGASEKVRAFVAAGFR